jgi:hypothetical protein
MARIARLNMLAPAEKHDFYRLLVPEKVFSLFEIDPESGVNREGETAVRYDCKAGSSEAAVEVKARLSDRDPVFYIEIGDSHDLLQLDWYFVLVNDVRAERFNTDFTADGKSRWMFWDKRNMAEELKAVEAGLAPGQVRRGLRLTDDINQALDRFCSSLGIVSIYMEALFYHTAIAFERNGFRYFKGEKLMRLIDREFEPGRRLHKMLKDENPFRRKSFYSTVRGRSWAIHDGVLDELEGPEFMEWVPPRMYRMVGQYHQVKTCSLCY